MIPRIAIDIVSSMLPVLILCSVVIITLRMAYLFNTKKPFVLYKELMALSFIMYILLLFELVTTTDYYSYGHNFVPFAEILRYSITSEYFYTNVIGNLVLFIPFGYYAAYYTKMNKWYLPLAVTLITSITIETIQMFVGRSFDMDDIILNVAGGMLGYLLYQVTSKLMTKYPDRFKNHLFLNLICILIIIALVFIILELYGALL